MGSLMKPDVQEQTSKVEVPQWVEDAAKGDIGYKQGIIDREYQQYQGDRGVSFNPMQNAAFHSANMFGNLAPGAFGNAYNALTDTTGASMMGNVYGQMGSLFDQMGGMGGNAAQADQQRANASLVNRGDIQDLQGGSFLDMNRDAYMNDYTDNVIGDVQSDIARQTDQQRNSNAANASAAGAFGGSRHGVVDAVSQSEANRNFGQLSNQMRSQAYDNASGLMGQDLGRQFQANAANQGMDWNTASQNSNLGTQTSQFNAGQGNALNQFNAGQQNQMNQYGMGQQASLLGQMGGLGQSLGNLSLMQGRALQDFGQAGMGAQLGAGDQIQGADMYNKNLDYNDWLEARDWGPNNFLLSGGLTPGGGFGQSTSQDVYGNSPLESILGAGAVGAGIYKNMGKSSRHYKTIHGEADIDKAASEVLSMPLYAWTYKEHHAPVADDPERIGPLAEDFGAAFEGDPEARMIDYQRHIAALHATVQHMDRRIKELEAK